MKRVHRIGEDKMGIDNIGRPPLPGTHAIYDEQNILLHVKRRPANWPTFDQLVVTNPTSQRLGSTKLYWPWTRVRMNGVRMKIAAAVLSSREETGGGGK